MMMSDSTTKGDPVTALSDSLLLERAGQGDEASFEILFYRHYDRVYGLLFRILGNRIEAEDVTQEVFLKLYKHPFRGQREHNVGGWLYRVATNMGYNHLRSTKRRWERNTLLLADATDADSQLVDKAIQVETKAEVRAALATLPQRQTQLLLLRQMGLSYTELAVACDIAPGSVGKLLSRAAQAFREAYQRQTGMTGE
jgi:RNA polymerase sigma-70 factor, ECF subfamily